LIVRRLLQLIKRRGYCQASVFRHHIDRRFRLGKLSQYRRLHELRPEIHSLATYSADHAALRH